MVCKPRWFNWLLPTTAVPTDIRLQSDGPIQVFELGFVAEKGIDHEFSDPTKPVPVGILHCDPVGLVRRATELLPWMTGPRSFSSSQPEHGVQWER
ncbi:MAG: hypothetical protein A2W31_14505 [Planctomycetes bacterium RBG_16_64_10]|nr:MAG: hypothetical protein A2W31_14505 [Planctomycetes bacterium RBG_16_64_10]